MNTIMNPHFNRLTRSTPTGLVAHMMAVTHFIHRKSMETLAATGRYPKLVLGYEGFMQLLAERDHSPGELADRLGITRQACSKTIRELEKIKLVERRPNPADSRSSLLSLTTLGQQLIRDGIEITNRLQDGFTDTLGDERAERLVAILEKLADALDADATPMLENLGREPGQRPPRRLNLLLPAISSYCYRYMIDALTEKGFRGLRPAFSQILSMIIVDQGRIQYIASVMGVSKQAIAATASEMESLGYISRETDPADRRQVILRLAPGGEKLMAESRDSMEALLATLRSPLDESEYALLKDAMKALYLRGIEHFGTRGSDPREIEQLSQDLLEKLGPADARALAQRLMTITRGNV